METYKKYLPKDKKINEGTMAKDALKVIDIIEEMMMDLEIAKDDSASSALDRPFNMLDKSYTKFKEMLIKYSKMSSNFLDN